MEKAESVSFHTLGCKLNQAETEAMSRQFTAAGYAVKEEAADICVLNTCTVTHIADRKSRHFIRLLRKTSPDAFIIVTGCCAETSQVDLSRAGADMIVNNAGKTGLLELLQKQRPAHSLNLKASVAHGQRVRSFVKIQHGCTNGCSYCIVPSVRGPDYSLPADSIIQDVLDRTADGYKEIVLTGTRVGAYKDNSVDLADLLQRILTETGIQRLHLSSLQPQELNKRILSLWHNKRLCPHFHLALQSGSDTVLQRMHRRYSISDYKSAVAKIRDVVPYASITTDIIVGFPGESDSEFENSYTACRDIGFAAIHVFMFSPRPGTAASSMDGQVDARVKKQRSLKMLALARESAGKYQRQFLGQVHDVLWESEKEPGTGQFDGLTENYIRVFANSASPLNNKLLPVKLLSLTRQGIRGELIP